MDIHPFKIAVSDSEISDLQLRLKLAKFPDELDAANWDLGAPLADVQRLTAYWRDQFDWRKAEQVLNRLPHFTTNLQCVNYESLKIHFIHKKSNVEGAIPLLYVHGWPGSFLEGSKMIDNLTQGGNGNPAFHLVIISLPNYGFSEGSKKRGFAIEQYAEICHKLMQKLEYTQYVTQGGDWGFYITRAIAIKYPKHAVAHHINFDQGTPPKLFSNPILKLEHTFKSYNKREKEGFARTSWFFDEGSGYRAEQSTKPSTLGFALADSPVALLAWIYEKLHDWTDDYPWTEDEICTWVSIYWFSTAGPAASVRIYYEATHDWNKLGKKKITRERVAQWIGGGVKLGLSHFPRDLRVLPSTWTRTQGNVVFEKEHPSGGHFAAWERPENLVSDLREMFGKGGGAYGVVRGRTGYGKATVAAKL